MKNLIKLACLVALTAATVVWAGPREDVAAASARGDYATELRISQAAARNGEAWAQNHLGFMFANGQGVAKNEAEAVRWYRLAAQQGQPSAQYNLGVMFANGQGVAKNDAEAVRWYRLAAQQGHAGAQNNLGVMFENGQGVAKNEAEAMRLYNLAAAQGNELAIDNLVKITVDRAVSSNTNPTQGGDCRPRTSNLVCQSTCSNGDCLVTYQNGCKVRVRVNPKFDPMTNNWTYPAPSC
jgi:hypothetical protein